MKRKSFLVVAAVLAAAVAVAGYRLYARHSTTPEVPAADAKPVPVDLRLLMRTSLHENYTRMSFTIWHDKPLTPEKMDAIAISAARMIETARDLNAYEPGYRLQGWGAQDVEFFDEKRLQLVRVAEELTRAAQKHDATQVVNFFMHMDTTCQSCHRRFRPDMVWN